ncbi:MAG: hypothetical protein H0V89_14725 [Deltaproteobacteria bacterium]|nr:hypothetical protein [Deltaproteobacteria bacterium]
MTAPLLLACLSDGERPVPAASAAVPAPVSVPLREHGWDPAAGDRSVSAKLGGPGFTGAGWSTRAAAHALGLADAPQGGTFTRAATTDEEVAAITRMLAFEPLLEPDGTTGEPSPRLATHWQVSSDGRTWSFRLNPAARWSDGTPVTAGDVVEAARRAGRPEVVTAVSPYIVQARAKAASWSAFTSFAALPIVSPTWLGSGPYRTDGTSLVRRADWWGDPDPVWDGLYNFASVELVPVPAGESALELLKAGTIDFAPVDRLQQWIEEIPGDPDVQRGLLVRRKFFTAADRPLHGLVFDATHPPLDDVRVRRALQKLLDRDRAINQVFFGELQPADWIVAPAAVPGVTYGFDELGAVRLLEEAGWTDTDGEGYRVRDGARLALTVAHSGAGAARWLSFYQESAGHGGVALALAHVLPPRLGRPARDIDPDLTEGAVAPDALAGLLSDPALLALVRAYDATFDADARAAPSATSRRRYRPRSRWSSAGETPPSGWCSGTASAPLRGEAGRSTTISCCRSPGGWIRRARARSRRRAPTRSCAWIRARRPRSSGGRLRRGRRWRPARCRVRGPGGEMSDAGLLIGWNRVAPGRDAMAVELWGEMLSYLMKLHSEGQVERFEPVLLGAHGGQLNGFVLVRGTQVQLDRLRNSEDFLVFNVRANKALEGFTVVRAHYGEQAAKILRLYGTV